MITTGYQIIFTLCAIALCGAVSICSTRPGPIFCGRIFITFGLGMLVATHALSIGWPQ